MVRRFLVERRPRAFRLTAEKTLFEAFEERVGRAVQPVRHDALEVPFDHLRGFLHGRE